MDKIMIAIATENGVFTLFMSRKLFHRLYPTGFYQTGFSTSGFRRET